MALAIDSNNVIVGSGEVGGPTAYQYEGAFPGDWDETMPLGKYSLAIDADNVVSIVPTPDWVAPVAITSLGSILGNI